jgi:hypothetical protein
MIAKTFSRTNTAAVLLASISMACGFAGMVTGAPLHSVHALLPFSLKATHPHRGDSILQCQKEIEELTDVVRRGNQKLIFLEIIFQELEGVFKKPHDPLLVQENNFTISVDYNAVVANRLYASFKTFSSNATFLWHALAGAGLHTLVHVCAVHVRYFISGTQKEGNLRDDGAVWKSNLVS